MPILDLQKRTRELGRIRIGHQVEGTRRDGSTYTRPEKLDRFRLTSQSKALLDKVAELYGGTVEEWTPRGGVQQWEVVTDAKRIPILVPPQPVTQWHEAWRASGCVHRCDGYTEMITGEPCDPEDPDHKEALTRPTTRLNVVLRNVEGLGVWRLESHGWNAAMELPDAAAFLERAGGYIEGHLALEERKSIGENQKGEAETRKFMVPIIEIDVTPAELLAGKGSIAPPAIGGPVAAITAGSGDSGLQPYFDLLDAAETTGDVMAVFEKAKADGILGEKSTAGKDHPLFVAIGDKGRALSAEAEPVEGQVVDDDEDTTALWMVCIGRAGELGMNLWNVQEALQEFAGVTSAEASVSILEAFLEDLNRREPVNA